jgi:hypothetical protein
MCSRQLGLSDIASADAGDQGFTGLATAAGAEFSFTVGSHGNVPHGKLSLIFRNGAMTTITTMPDPCPVDDDKRMRSAIVIKVICSRCTSLVER